MFWEAALPLLRLALLKCGFSLICQPKWSFGLAPSVFWVVEEAYRDKGNKKTEGVILNIIWA